MAVDSAGPSLEEIIRMLGGSAASDPLTPRPAAPAELPPVGGYLPQPALQATHPDVARETFLQRFAANLAQSPDVGLPPLVQGRGGSPSSGGSTLARALFTAAQTAGNSYGRGVLKDRAAAEKQTEDLNRFEMQKAAAQNQLNARVTVQDEASRIRALRKAAEPKKTVTKMVDGKPVEVSATTVWSREHPKPDKASANLFDPVDKTALKTSDQIEKDAMRQARLTYWGAQYPKDPETFAKMVRIDPPIGVYDNDQGVKAARTRKVAVRAHAMLNSYRKSKTPEQRASLDELLDGYEAQTPGVKAALTTMLHGR